MRRTIACLFAALMFTGLIPVHATSVMDGATVGSHLVAHAGVASPNGRPSGFLGVEDPDGNMVMFAFFQNARIYISDGQDDGVAHRPIELPGSVGSAWRRFDVLLQGDTYTFLVNQATVATARTFTPATRGSHMADPHGAYNALFGHGWPSETVRRWGERVDDDNLRQDTTFTQTLASTGFSEYKGDGDVRLQPNNQGHRSGGMVEIVRGATPGVTYVYAPRPADAPQSYHVRAAISPGDTIITPGGLAVMAGLAGPIDSPRVQWAIVLERVGVDAWAIAYLAPDGDLTRISSERFNFDYRSVHTVIDESTGTLVVQVDDEAVWTFTQEMEAADRIGFGDVFTDPVDEALRFGIVGLGRYDNVAIYDAAS